MTYTREEEETYGVRLDHGDEHYRAFVGGPGMYSLYGAAAFDLLAALGLREHHYVLDIGCGSLRLGRILIPFVLPGRYGAVDPNERIVNEAIDKELGRDLLEIKKPVIVHNASFDFPRLREPYDYAVAFSIFSHASLGQIETCLEKLGGVLKDDGVFVATFCPIPPFSRMPEYEGDEWVYPNVTHFRPSTVRRAAESRGFHFRILRANPFTYDQVWAAFLKKKMRIPLRPYRAWGSPPHHVARPLTSLAYRILWKLGMKSKRTDWYLGGR